MYAIESLFLDKKSYFDLLGYVDDNDEEHKVHDDLARMKGFPTPCIGYYAKDKMSVLDVYRNLYDNKSIEIDLTNQDTKCVFRNTPEFNVKSLFLW